MLNKKEIILVFVVAIVLAFSITLVQTIQGFLYALLLVFIILIMNIAAKKITSFYFDSEVEVKLWEMKRYGIRPGWKLKKPFPIGVFLPIFSKLFFFTINSFAWMASLIFDVKAKTYRAAKRHGLYSFSEMTEEHIGYIAASGIAVNLILAVIGYLIGFPLFAKLNIYYAFFNMIPISNLDGNKIFFGSIVLWSFLAIITLIGMLYAFLL